ncbi:uncharacterized protein PHACADRAFT_258795 [Phanerochaete carnosa HHB-10118-sp]|uniref:Uncharacterized protein n=1 Tax=Phanerochaete carnosa (strain HHB-10118-sp) TaxID=650164 RepID=K5W6H3_PHACS|nr:uncharacterized protein PHACADRAFT_258795 [Phanerochaete carnosa HHB-10118-sp]EKM54750.1 hypothetical protein PHACADRAFT_258795 [Phanerochaete carnosa HHB-10118-sp]
MALHISDDSTAISIAKLALEVGADATNTSKGIHAVTNFFGKEEATKNLHQGRRFLCEGMDTIDRDRQVITTTDLWQLQGQHQQAQGMGDELEAKLSKPYPFYKKVINPLRPARRRKEGKAFCQLSARGREQRLVNELLQAVEETTPSDGQQHEVLTAHTNGSEVTIAIQDASGDGGGSAQLTGRSAIAAVSGFGFASSYAPGELEYVTVKRRISLASDIVRNPWEDTPASSSSL